MSKNLPQSLDNDLIPVLDSIQTEQEKQLPALSSQERRCIIDEKVRNMILRGKSRPQCLKFIAQESKRLGFETTESHCSNIFHQVKSTLRKEFDESREDILSDISQKLYYLYERSIEQEDIKEARGCLTDIAKLCGITGNQVNIAKSGTDEVINIQFS